MARMVRMVYATSLTPRSQPQMAPNAAGTSVGIRTCATSGLCRRSSGISPPRRTLPEDRLRRGSAPRVDRARPARLGSADNEEEGRMAVVKIIELVGSSSESSDGAVQAALNDARQTLRNIKAVDVVSTGLRGENLDEWRAHVRVAFLIERVSE